MMLQLSFLRTAKAAFALCALLATCAALAQTPQHVDVGGRKLTLLTQGHGGPTVVIDSGLGSPAVEEGAWKQVFDEVEKTNRVCLYDRAGLGTSDPSPTTPRTSKDIAKDLHTLLTNAKIPGPYVLVGQSIGGLNVRVFAGMYPNDAAGMVLVDSTHPDQEHKWLAALSEKRADEDPEITKARDFLNARLANPADNSEHLDVVASGVQARNAGTFGNKPLAVLTHSPKWKMVPGLPDDASLKLEDVSRELQNELTKLSTNSSHKVAEKAGHHIHAEDPTLVIQAIREVVGKVGAGNSK